MLSLLIDMIRNRYKILKCNFRLSVEDNDYEVVYGKLSFGWNWKIFRIRLKLI